MTRRAELIRECRHWVREVLRVSGMRRDWTIILDFSRRDESDAYACAISQPQYWRARVCFDFEHQGFKMWRESDSRRLRRLVLHELGHVFWSPYSKVAEDFGKKVGGKPVIHALDLLEDQRMTAWEQMPCWKLMRPYKPLRP